MRRSFVAAGFGPQLFMLYKLTLFSCCLDGLLALLLLSSHAESHKELRSGDLAL